MSREQKTNNDGYVLFWKHTGPIALACFSQWYMRDFTIDGQCYCCMELMGLK